MNGAASLRVRPVCLTSSSAAIPFHGQLRRCSFRSAAFTPANFATAAKTDAGGTTIVVPPQGESGCPSGRTGTPASGTVPHGRSHHRTRLSASLPCRRSPSSHAHTRYRGVGDLETAERRSAATGLAVWRRPNAVRPLQRGILRRLTELVCGGATALRRGSWGRP